MRKKFKNFEKTFSLMSPITKPKKLTPVLKHIFLYEKEKKLFRLRNKI